MVFTEKHENTRIEKHNEGRNETTKGTTSKRNTVNEGKSSHAS
jgi:hypothetical protein